MHPFAVTPNVLPTPLLQPLSLARRLRQALAGWGLRLWQALCAQAERPGRRVPYY